MHSIYIYKNNDKLKISLPDALIGSNISSTLTLLGFKSDDKKNFIINIKSIGLIKTNKLIIQLNSYFITEKYECKYNQESRNVLLNAIETYRTTKKVKELAENLLTQKNFEDGLLHSKEFKRSLMDFQKESVNHLVKMPFAANFSVPGSGKTTIVYAAYSKLKENGEVNKILIVGPSPVYLAWQEEFNQCFGKKPKLARIIGDLKKRKNIYEKQKDFEIFVITYQMLANDVLEVQKLLKNNNFLVVLDESHYVKNFKDGKWASAVLDIAPYASRRIILTGTPVPNTLLDLWSQFTFLDPSESILRSKGLYQELIKNSEHKDIGEKLLPYYRRIKKNELGLPTPSCKIIETDPKPLQKKIYDIIAKNILSSSKYNLRERKYIKVIKRAKLVRLMQVASNPKLLSEKSEEFDILPLGNQKGIEELDNKIKKIIQEHEKEDSSKLEDVEKLTRSLVEKGKKVLIWTPWISNIKLLEKHLVDLNPVSIYGDIPISEENYKEDNREMRIRAFKDDPKVKVLIANPGACGESISLHTVCHDAIYMDRTFNGAQFMQSLDRIHRVGLDKNDKINYYIFLTKNTIDKTIHRRLNEKMNKMYEILKDDSFNLLDLESSRENISDLKEDEESDYISVLEDLQGRENVK